ncbi:MAG TPA: hypothetical protein VHG91_12390, partial [Longimicrobium sp.]|nr:hypothetical protein [Longimicrobium sp.]
MRDGSHQRKSTLGGVAVALALFAGGVAVCYDERREPASGEVAEAGPDPAVKVPARVDTILDDGRTVVSSDGWTRSVGLKFRLENGVLHI